MLDSAEPNSILLRRAGLGDIPKIIELAGSIWRSYYPAIISQTQIEYMLGLFYDPVKMISEIQEHQIEYWLLEDAEEAIGFMSFGPAPDPAGPLIKLHKLYLQPSYHSRGLGGLLLGRVEQECKSRGVPLIRLNVNKNNRRAIRSYERNGFQTIDAVLVDIGGGYFMDDYVMEKRV